MPEEKGTEKGRGASDTAGPAGVTFSAGLVGASYVRPGASGPYQCSHQELVPQRQMKFQLHHLIGILSVNLGTF